MFNQLYIKFFILETDYDYKCSLAKELFILRLINFGSMNSLGRKYSQIEAEESLNKILAMGEDHLPTLPEYWLSIHTYNCLLLNKKKWNDSKIFKEYLKNINQFRRNRGLIPDEIIFDDEMLEIVNRPKNISSFIIMLVNQSDFNWDSEYFSDELYDFLYDEAYKKICERMGTKR